MRIEILQIPQGDVIAREVNLDDFVGDFITTENGTVFYRHQQVGHTCFANSDGQRFVECARVWNRYTEVVVHLKSEPEQLGAVAEMKQAIDMIESLDQHPESFWPLVIEQAEVGMQ